MVNTHYWYVTAIISQAFINIIQNWNQYLENQTHYESIKIYSQQGISGALNTVIINSKPVQRLHN